MPTPNKARLRLWVEWLLDPSHQQGQNGLRLGNAYCCLGGACEVYKAKTGKGTWSNSATTDSETGKHFQIFTAPPCEEEDEDYNSGDSVMPEPVAAWFGLKRDGNPKLAEDGDIPGYGCASSLNDRRKWTFAQIARAITETFELDKKENE